MTAVHVSPPDVLRRNIRIRVGDSIGLAPLHIDGLFGGLNEPSTPVTELLVAAVGAYVADRSLPRAASPDRWARQIQLSIPVHHPTSWPVERFANMLSVLTNDTWAVHPYRAPRSFRIGAGQQQLPADADCASLFSAGLDSYGYAVSLRSKGHSPLLVGHWDTSRLRSLQSAMATITDTTVRAEGRLRQFHAATIPALVQGREPEKTSRSRGALFLSAGVAAASAAELPTLDVPENGFIGLNSPLTAARAGALSTRSTHPHVLALMNALLDDLGIPVRIRNPLMYLTKGDVVRLALPCGIGGVAESISCSHPAGDRWRGDARYINCGYCYPCLVRRAGIEAALVGVDPTEYRHDPRTEVQLLDSKRRADLFAVVAALGRTPTLADVRAVAPLPSWVDQQRISEMREQSFLELRQMLNNGMDGVVRRRLGL